MTSTSISWITSSPHIVQRPKYVPDPLRARSWLSSVCSSGQCGQSSSGRTGSTCLPRCRTSFRSQNPPTELITFYLKGPSGLPQAYYNVNEHDVSHAGGCDVWRLRLPLCKYVRSQYIRWVVYLFARLARPLTRPKGRTLWRT